MLEACPENADDQTPEPEEEESDEPDLLGVPRFDLLWVGKVVSVFVRIRRDKTVRMDRDVHWR